MIPYLFWSTKCARFKDIIRGSRSFQWADSSKYSPVHNLASQKKVLIKATAVLVRKRMYRWSQAFSSQMAAQSFNSSSTKSESNSPSVQVLTDWYPAWYFNHQFRRWGLQNINCWVTVYSHKEEMCDHWYILPILTIMQRRSDSLISVSFAYSWIHLQSSEAKANPKRRRYVNAASA